MNDTDAAIPCGTQQRDTVVNLDNNHQTVSTDINRDSLIGIKSRNTSTITRLKVLTAILFILVLALGAYLLYDKLNGKDSVKQRPTTEPSYSALKATQGTLTHRAISERGITSSIREAYRLTGDGSSWDPEPNNKLTFSRPIHDKRCIMITQPGEYELYSKVTLKYKQALSVYHTLKHVRADSAVSGRARGLNDYIVEKNNFQWDPPMSGRTPSTLQTMDTISAGAGDMICVETEHSKDIYVSRADNKLIITQVK